MDKVYRCGWCGSPCKEDGGDLGIDIGQFDEYLEEHSDCEEVLVNGECCPNGPFRNETE